MREAKIGTIRSPLQTDLDSITDEIVENLKVEVALISVSYNSALVALGVSGSKSHAETSRFFEPSDRICASVIRSDAPLVVTDARRDTRTSSNPSVAAGRVAGYLGMPVRNAEIGTIGAVCAVTSTPRAWSEGDTRYLRAVSKTVENLVLREMYRLESADASNVISEYDQIIAAFSLVRAAATSIHNDAGRLVFANKALMEHVGDDELQSSDLTKRLLTGAADDVRDIRVMSGRRFRVKCQRTSSGYLVCQWALDEAMLN